MSKLLRSAVIPLALVIGLAFAVHILFDPWNYQQQPDYSTFQTQITQGKIKRVTLHTKDNTITVDPRGKAASYETAYPDNTERELITSLEKQDIPITVKGKSGNALVGLLTFLLPFLLILFILFFFMNQASGGGAKQITAFGKSRAKRLSPDSAKITFRDVAGADEAIEEMQEIKDFLQAPKRYLMLGARIPKGVLLYGPPGTGKTLLARAVAGEAGVPFFSISGSDFVEMFVGVGAARVRDTFEEAKKHAPSIIFLDEIDAVGRQRGAGLGGGNDEREQTLNQLLVEMDGFEAQDNIIMIAATNRPDVLDPALLRPGRFDRQITVDRPDRKGREQILKVHTRGKPIAKEVGLDALARQTPGFTGADLSNLVNEAALLAARRGEKVIKEEHLEEGIMRVIAGPERKSRLLSDAERRITAYHEMGHALVAHYLEHTDPVHKISVISRGQALGYTISLPAEDKFLSTRSELKDSMAMTLGGRAAEEIIFDEITTGASNDLEKVTQTAKRMIMRFGMSEALGPRVFGHEQSQPFLGREFSSEPDYSDRIAEQIDEEVRAVVEEAHGLAVETLTKYRKELDLVSEILLRQETIDRDQFLRLLDGEEEEVVFAAPKTPPAQTSEKESSLEKEASEQDQPEAEAIDEHGNDQNDKQSPKA